MKSCIFTIRIDSEEKTVGKLGTLDVPNNPLRLIPSFQSLPDGYILVIHWLSHGYLATTGQFCELDEPKPIVRQFTDHTRFPSINKMQIFNAPGDPTKDGVWH